MSLCLLGGSDVTPSFAVLGVPVDLGCQWYLLFLYHH